MHINRGSYCVEIAQKDKESEGGLSDKAGKICLHPPGTIHREKRTKKVRNNIHNSSSETLGARCVAGRGTPSRAREWALV